MKFRIVPALLLVFLLPAGAHAAEPPALLKLPNFDSLTERASESVSITLDSTLLGLAARFLDAEDPEDAAAKDLIGGLQGIYVRSFTFEDDFAYPQSDIQSLRKQLAAPGWQRLVEVRSRKESAHVDIYISVLGEKANGLAIIASEPREFTIVNIVGSIDLEKLHKLEGQFGIPELELERRKQND